LKASTFRAYLARKYTMGNEVELESKYLQGLAPTSGFLTYGEFYNYNGKNRFMNYTFTATSISEGDSAVREGVYEISSKPDKELIRLRALVTHNWRVKRGKCRA